MLGQLPVVVAGLAADRNSERRRTTERGRWAAVVNLPPKGARGMLESTV
jgi:hypothetical protein